MFVGQIPRAWTEKELRELFTVFGEVFEINIVKDWTQKPPVSRGSYDVILFLLSDYMQCFFNNIADDGNTWCGEL